jgi:hypothetical protein
MRASVAWTEAWIEEPDPADVDVVTLPEHPAASIQIAAEERTTTVVAIRHALIRRIVASG